MKDVVKNPFAYGVFVSGEQFYDRAEIRKSLLRYIENDQNVLLYGPRRYGKSSLAADVMQELVGRGHTAIWFDFMKVNSLEHFVAEYAHAAYAVAGKRERNLQKILAFFRALRPRLSIGADGATSFGVDISVGQANVETLEEVLSLPERIAGDGRIVVFFDEFQEIERLSSELALERVFRSVIQRQKHVTYVFLGSKTHTLKRMFTDASRPFYESAAILFMAKPPIEESRAFICERFASQGFGCPDSVVERILVASRNIPYYLQLLGAEIFDLARERGEHVVCDEDVDAAIEKIRRQKRDVFESRLETMTANQRSVVSALAHEETKSFGDEYRNAHVLAHYTTVKSAVQVLQDRGILECEGGVYRVADPFFAAYLKECVYAD